MNPNILFKFVSIFVFLLAVSKPAQAQTSLWKFGQTEVPEQSRITVQLDDESIEFSVFMKRSLKISGESNSVNVVPEVDYDTFKFIKDGIQLLKSLRISPNSGLYINIAGRFIYKNTAPLLYSLSIIRGGIAVPFDKLSVTDLSHVYFVSNFLDIEYGEETRFFHEALAHLIASKLYKARSKSGENPTLEVDFDLSKTLRRLIPDEMLDRIKEHYRLLVFEKSPLTIADYICLNPESKYVNFNANGSVYSIVFKDDQITSLEGFEYIPYLESVDFLVLENLSIGKLPQKRLDGKPLFAGFNLLKRLWLINLQIREIYSNTFDGLSELDSLRIGDNKYLRKISFDAFRPLRKLYAFFLYGNERLEFGVPMEEALFTSTIPDYWSFKRRYRLSEKVWLNFRRLEPVRRSSPERPWRGIHGM